MAVLPPPFQGPEEPGEQQGELLVLPMRFVVAPDYGRFHPASLARAGDGHLAVAPGALIGQLHNHTTVQPIHSPFGGRLDLWLVSAGQIVTPGQPLCSLHPTAGGTAPAAQTAGGG
jgi:hypothetical protein